MKTEPTEVDRLAARLFAPHGGMRAAWRGERNGVRPVWERLRDGSEATPDFYDVDDGPTQGAMLAQVEAAAGPVSMSWDRWTGGQEHYVIRYLDRWKGPTRGAALVAAMKALRGAT